MTTWLTWCRDKKRWPAPGVPDSCERRKEHVDATKDVLKSALERQISRRDIPLREKTLWRMLYETAARANEGLALKVEALDLDNCRAPIRSKGGETEWVYWGTGTAHLLPRDDRTRSNLASGGADPYGVGGVVVDDGVSGISPTSRRCGGGDLRGDGSGGRPRPAGHGPHG